MTGRLPYLTWEGDIWDVWGREGVDLLCVTTCAQVTRRFAAPQLVMGRGSALEAARRFPGLAGIAGGLLAQPTGDLVPDYHLLPVSVDGHRLGLLQTKRSPFDPSPPDLVQASLTTLRNRVDQWGWRNIHLVKPAVGLGGLSHATVDALLAETLDSRFTVWTLP